MKKIKLFFSHPFTLLFLRIIISALFIYSGATKILDLSKFAIEVSRYGILPLNFINLFAIFLPWFEIFSGFFLLFKKFYKGALVILLSLITVFTIALFWTVIRGISIDCGCFSIGSFQTKTGISLIIRNIVIFTVLLYLFLSQSRGGFLK